jgi:TetR/AcrR family transcriptional regulator, regulator of autoinduction and epiphytic fitness
MSVARGGVEKVDGRRERSKRTHAAIVAALTELLDEGRIEPTAADVAERAGVAVRSIAQHFATREELLLAVAAHHGQRLEHDHGTLEDGESFEQRLDRFVTVRSRELEASRAMRGAAAVVQARSPAVQHALQRAAERRRAEAARVFAAEIAHTEDPKATERTVALITSGRAWDALRTDMRLGQKAARDQLAISLRCTLVR